MEIFKDYHAKVKASYFLAVIFITMLTRNPAWVSLSFLFASISTISLHRFSFYLKRLIGYLPIFLLLLLFNSLFNSRGLTLLFYLGQARPVTLESLLYGFFTGLSIFSILLWFISFHYFIKSDDILEIFGQRLPTTGLILSMILKFLPDTLEAGQKIILNQKAFLGQEKLKAKDKRNSLFRLFSILLSLSMENALETADSMQARHYPSDQRKTYVRQVFNSRDKTFLIAIGLIFFIHLLSLIFKASQFIYYPFMVWQSLESNPQLFYISLASLLLLLLLPYIIKLFNIIKWKQILAEEEKRKQEIKRGLIIYE